MEDFKFSSLEELHQKVMPALNTKVADLKRHNIRHIKEADIWHYLRNHYWAKAERLSLGEIVNDILSTPNQELEAYVVKPDYRKKRKEEKENLL